MKFTLSTLAVAFALIFTSTARAQSGFSSNSSISNGSAIQQVAISVNPVLIVNSFGSGPVSIVMPVVISLELNIDHNNVKGVIKPGTDHKPDHHHDSTTGAHDSGTGTDGHGSAGSGSTTSGTTSGNVLPEPASIILLGMGFAGVAGRVLKRRKQADQGSC